MKKGRQRKAKRKRKMLVARMWTNYLLEDLESNYQSVCTILEGDEPMKLGLVAKFQSSNNSTSHKL
jgi:hypothetical protein